MTMAWFDGHSESRTGFSRSSGDWHSHPTPKFVSGENRSPPPVGFLVVAETISHSGDLLPGAEAGTNRARVGII
jgi:hypothetical protein